jgi:transcriptional regulator with XRE-family HTH domain
VSPGSLVRAVRIRNGLSQADLARRAGTSQPVVSAYEHDRRDPTVGTLARLVAAGGERLRLTATPVASSDVPPAASLEEHGERLLDVLSVADAIPPRRRSRKLDAPRIVSV